LVQAERKTNNVCTTQKGAVWNARGSYFGDYYPVLYRSGVSISKLDDTIFSYGVHSTSSFDLDDEFARTEF